eukprot:6070474-Prymnesium_polylepis.1
MAKEFLDGNCAHKGSTQHSVSERQEGQSRVRAPACLRTNDGPSCIVLSPCSCRPGKHHQATSLTSASESAKSCQPACFSARSDDMLCAGTSGLSGSRAAEASSNSSLSWAACSCGPRTTRCIVAAICRLADASAAASAWLIMPLTMRMTSSSTAVSMANVDVCVPVAGTRLVAVKA